MPVGMLGFPGKSRFILLDRKESKPFLWYQCVDDPSLAFVIMNPYLFNPDYSLNIQQVMKEMSWKNVNAEDLSVFVVVNIPHGAPERITANLMAPLILNIKKLEALQKVFHDSPYSHKYPIFSDNE
jgi:flagellar assembly factor FliW